MLTPACRGLPLVGGTRCNHMSFTLQGLFQHIPAYLRSLIPQNLPRCGEPLTIRLIDHPLEPLNSCRVLSPALQNHGLFSSPSNYLINKVDQYDVLQNVQMFQFIQNL